MSSSSTSGPSHGVDVGEDGAGALVLEIAFLEPGAEAYAFAFG